MSMNSIDVGVDLYEKFHWLREKFDAPVRELDWLFSGRIPHRLYKLSVDI